MELTAVLLVLASTATHAYWNFLIKRSGGGSTFIGLSKVAEVFLFAPVFIIWYSPVFRDVLHAWPLIAIGAFLTLTNYVALGRAYETGDLSVVYPVARGGTLIFLPTFGFLVFGERLSFIGWVAIACIVAGIVTIRLPAFDLASVRRLGRMLWHPSIAYALLAALSTASYTVWDKRSVQILPAFAYFYSYSVIVGVLYAAFLRTRHTMPALRAEWRIHGWPIVQVGFFNTTSYWLVLIALKSGTSSYVLALRQLSIGIGVLLGWKLLGEDLAPPKQVGVGLLVAGCLLVALA
ncbi:MAG: EamA family transporter [Gemmatimonadota bacterium]